MAKGLTHEFFVCPLTLWHSGEDKPDLTVQVLHDGKRVAGDNITAENTFTYDNKFVLTGADAHALLRLTIRAPDS